MPTIHDLVNQAIGQMTHIAPAPTVEHNLDFLQNNPRIDAYATTSRQHYFDHLKLETYDRSIDPLQHMHRFTSSMHVYNASDIACYRMFPSSLTGQTLAWYSHFPVESISSFRDLGEILLSIF